LRWRQWQTLGGLLAVGLLGLAMVRLTGGDQAPAEAPEENRVLAVQASMPFQILIPAYLPREFDRAGVDIKVDQLGPGGEPMVELSYHTPQGATLFLREWVPVNPDMEVLASSRPIITKWGKGWLLTQGGSLSVVWVDVGPLRVSAYTNHMEVVPRENLVGIANSVGPASARQVFTFSLENPSVSALPPPPPFEVQVNKEGVQELTLVITPGGYTPLRFAVRRGVPVRLTFRQLGQVGCGNELIFPADPRNPSALSLASDKDKKVLEFTPQQAGEFEFYCSHHMYRGVMTVRE